jgi:hypothetical protein
MGLSTFLVAFLPTYKSWGIAAPITLIALRLLQGLALGGEYGGAATYIAEHAPDGKRGFYTSWIQTTATMGIVLALLVILVCRLGLGDQAFGDWGWRVPFLISAILVGLSIYIRLKLEESPLYARLKEQGKSSHNPALESFSSGKNWGYGSSVPVTTSSVLLDLGRLNQIVDFSEELAYVTVEPGVTQGQLHEFLQARKSNLWLDATGAGPDCSLIGNVMERGFGHTPYGDHFAQVCGFEVVLPTGDMAQTGFARFPNSQTAARLYESRNDPWRPNARRRRPSGRPSTGPCRRTRRRRGGPCRRRCRR